MKLFRPIILAAAVANNANHVPAAIIDDDDNDNGSIPRTTLTGLRLSDGYRGMGRRLFTTGDSLDGIEGIDDLQRNFFSVHGRNVTAQELDDALDDAYIRTMANDGANLQFKFDDDLLLELERGRALKAGGAVAPGAAESRTIIDAADQHTGKRNLQSSTAFPPSGSIIRGATGMLVSLQSPGFPGNPGYRSGINGLFWCVSLTEVAQFDIKTPLNQKLTLKNCKLADIREIEWIYASNFELLLSRVGTFFHEFCARTEDGQQDIIDEKIRLNQCGLDINTTQAWELYTNYQWRSAQNENLCVATSEGNEGGGSLKLKTCVGPNTIDMFDAGQLWALCSTEASCAVGTGRFDRQLPVNCDINQICAPRGRRGAT